MDAVLILIIVFALVICGSLLVIFLNKIIGKIEEDPLAKLREEIDTQNAATIQHYFDTVAPILQSTYQDCCDVLGKPEGTLTLDVLTVTNEKELEEIQKKLPEQWNNWPDGCHCWVKDRAFYILETFNAAEEKAKRSPDAYDTPEKIKRRLRNIAIPLDKIHYYKAKGELIHSQRAVLPASASYSGVSMNGVGFGEIETTPEIAVPQIFDTRYIVLYYRSNDVDELQTLYFGYDSLDALIRVIPQYESN